jgi:hypothetical protein
VKKLKCLIAEVLLFITLMKHCKFLMKMLTCSSVPQSKKPNCSPYRFSLINGEMLMCFGSDLLMDPRLGSMDDKRQLWRGSDRPLLECRAVYLSFHVSMPPLISAPLNKLCRWLHSSRFALVVVCQAKPQRRKRLG